MFFDGFGQLRHHFDELAESADPVDDLIRVIAVFRAFVCANPALAQVMFSRPFADFDPGPEELYRNVILQRARASCQNPHSTGFSPHSTGFSQKAARFAAFVVTESLLSRR
jgi:hypothetical protein